jgi:putative effector of murein hydrolase LrgA (UPF0299 family)
MGSGASLRRRVAGFAGIVAAWFVGRAVESLTGFPAAIAGLLVVAAVLLAVPAATERVGPAADVTIRWLPLLFVPLAVGGVPVLLDAAAPLGIAVVTSVPVGFVVTAWLAR